jgi:exopolysaccharide biosynthesis protein
MSKPKSRIEIEHEKIQKRKRMEAQDKRVRHDRIEIDDDNEDDEIIPRVSRNHAETDEFERKMREKAIRKNGELKTKYDGYDKAKIALSAIFKLGVVAVIAFMIVMYGPWSGFREWLITTAMTTMHHQYFATWFFDPDVITETLEKNKVELRDDTTDTSLVDTTTDTQVTEYASEYERQILERDPKNNDYKIIPLKDKNFTGYMVAVYEPKRLKVAVTSKLGVTGEYVTKMAEDHDALIAINGGGFVDNASYSGNGETPMGLSIVDGDVVGPNAKPYWAGLIGFDDDDKLVLGNLTTAQAQAQGIRDALTFGPFLLINGEPSDIKGDGGWGNAPRTAIGQRADGIVLLMVVEGRKAGQIGATIREELEIMQLYGAVNAANLDGGTSSVLVVGTTIVNDPIDSAFAHKTRPISSCFYLEKDESDDSDHHIVQSKLDKTQE